MATHKLKPSVPGQTRPSSLRPWLWSLLPWRAFICWASKGPIVQWAALLVGLVAAAVFLVSEPGRQFVAFAVMLA
jgi:hypothetical protein